MAPVGWFRGVPAVEAEVTGTGGHRVLWRRGALRLLDHVGGDVVLAALGDRDPCLCLLVRDAFRPSPHDASLAIHAEMLDRIGRRGAHFQAGKAAQVAQLTGDEAPARRRMRSLAAAHLLDTEIVDRLVLGHLVALERRASSQAFNVLATRAANAARTAFGGVLGGRSRIRVGLAVGEEPASLGVETAPGGSVSLVLLLPLSWLREVWWPGDAVHGNALVLDASGRSAQLQRRRTGWDVLENVP